MEPLWVLAVGSALLVPARFLPMSLASYVAAGRPYLVFALMSGWPLRWLAYGRLSRPTPLDWPLALLVLWLPINFWASTDKLLSWEALSYLAFGLALYYSLLNWPPAWRYPQLVAGAILLFGTGLLGVAPLLSQLTAKKLFTLAVLDPLLQRLATLTPGNVNANRLAGVLVVILPLWGALALRWDWSQRRYLPWLCTLLSGITLVMLFLARSRGAYVATTVVMGMLLILRWPRLVYALPLALLAAALALYWLGPAALLDQVGSNTALAGADTRLEVWNRALYALADFPFTGIGIGTFDLVIPLLYPLFLVAPGAPVSHAHNLFLQVGLDLGLPGLIAYLALHINAFVLLAEVLRRRENALAWALAAGTAGGLAAMFVHGLLDAPLWGSRPAFLPWLLVTLAVLLGLQTHEGTIARSPVPGAARGRALEP